MATKAKKTPENHDESILDDFARRFKANPLLFTGTVLILVIVIVAFVFVPAMGSGDRGGIDRNFGYYNKVPIAWEPGNFFYRVQDDLARQYQYNMDESNYLVTHYQIWRTAFDETVIRTAILDEMKRAGYTAPAALVDRSVAQLSEFQENGRFSQAKYNQMDKNRQISLWNDVRDEIAQSFYIQDMMYLKNPMGEGSFIRLMSSPQRMLDMVSFPISSYPNSEVVSYVRSNPAMFRVTHLSKITITSSEREARQILTSIQNGTESFEDAARSMSRDYYAESGGDMGSRMAFELLSEIPDEQAREQVINLPAGALSDVIRVYDNSWVIFRAEETARPADTEDAITIDRIRSYMLNNERGRVEDWVIADAENFIYSTSAENFDNAAYDRGIYKNTFGPMPINYGDVVLFSSVQSTGLYELSSAGTNERFWQACFMTPLNSWSFPVVIGTNVVFIYPTEEMDADEEQAEFIEMYYSYWLGETFEGDIRSYFFNNGKLDDRFWDVYSYYFMQ